MTRSPLLCPARLNLLLRDKHIDDTWKQLPADNVWVGRYYRWSTYTVPEAIECHRETQHPTMYGHPDAPLLVDIELNMQGEKSTRFVDNFQRMAMIEHRFDHGEERQILVLAKGEENLKAAQEAGAALVGGPDLIKNIQSGDVKLSDYQFVVAHPNIMAELVAVRGLLKRKFPNPKNGTLGANVADMVRQYLNGIQYAATKDEHQQNYGIIRTCIGRLSMPTEQLEANLAALLCDVNVLRPRREGRFVTRVLLRTTPSREQLKIDPFVYIPEGGKSRKTALLEAEEAEAKEEADAEAQEEEEEEAQKKKKASN